IKAITNGRMAEVIIEASGNAAAVRSTIDYVSYAGRISLVGLAEK
ncbi:alcohol dehydrogenase, partial [Pelosinus fermentans B4]